MKTRKIPQRMCLGCQEMKPKKDLIRVVRTPEGTVELDPTGKRNGRGAYICLQVDCFRAAVKGKRFQKALELELSPQVIEELERKLGGS
ncbi:putative nucleic-acid-binding protein implicated in transcription termination [Desulfitobacterium dichloroeliminans LMG P-21439]|uniref:Putative nucleic-acid-binding protein implicated in transcription termination n=1 Tax=Desulfitobacterium dichloroeliminans (strain LMG P-21439 / DCA1) TaxID=871963 RepID=L0FAQ3_DESDL|nr:YlxR family protein [Desulfitobacterium dichloroeliminans]AGA69998.1 putative nucleic-acid-binding protein implicated in transcription termination [Desulfitobacterium dichloroeliminans LMG P-21439]